jgi:hypothetical protein
LIVPSRPIRFALLILSLQVLPQNKIKLISSEKKAGPDGIDRLGGRWENIGLWTPKSFQQSRAARRLR